MTPICSLFQFGEEHERERLEFLSQARAHIKAACLHVITKSGLSIPLLKYFRCLQPSRRKSSVSVGDIAVLARALPFEIDIALLQDEWRLLQTEKDVITGGRIDVYWAQFFGLKTSLGDLKYPTVATVVKAVLVLEHGSGDVERGFSFSGNYLTDDKASMSERVLTNVMDIKSGMTSNNYTPLSVPITKELLNLARYAYASYKAHLEDERKKKEKEAKEKQEEEERKLAEEELKKSLMKETKDISNDEKKVEELKKNENSKRKAEEKLITEATKHLKKAIEKGDISEATVAHSLLEGAQKVRTEIKATSGKINTVQKSVDKRKSSAISNVLSKLKRSKK